MFNKDHNSAEAIVDQLSRLERMLSSRDPETAFALRVSNNQLVARKDETALRSAEGYSLFDLLRSTHGGNSVSGGGARLRSRPTGFNERAGGHLSYETDSPTSAELLSSKVNGTPWGELKKLINDLRICSQAPNAPILAIMGLLNAGKSSLVATYLSEKGRRRILIGSGNKQGTHRFVLWLPSQWKETEQVWRFIEDRLLTIFPAGYEYLSENPEQAAEQYNDTSVRLVEGALAGSSPVSMLEVPLVAFDSGLDALKIALMDCPDVQTGWLPSADHGASNSSHSRDPLALEVDSIAAKRLQTLSSVAPICSAFVVVLPANGMHDQKVSELMQVIRSRMPHSQQLIAVNRVPRKYMPEQIHQEVCNLYADRLLQRIYMAYSFEGPNLLERLPAPPDYYIPPRDGTKLPLFFRLDSDDGLGKNPSVGRSWLLGIGEELDSHGLMVDVIRSQTSTLVTKVRDAMSKVQKVVLNMHRQREAMQEQLIEACLDFSREPGSYNRVRLQASRQIVEQISESLERTAPWWAMPGRWTTRLATYGKQQVGQWVKLPTWVTGKAEDLLKQIRQSWGSQGGASVVTAEALLKALERSDASGVWGLDSSSPNSQTSDIRSEWLKLLQQGIDRFQTESRTTLDSTSLDEATRRMWEQMPLSKRIATGLAPAAVLFAPLAAVILLPFDFGGSSVLVFASLKELLGAGVAGIGIAMLSPDRMPNIAESEAAWQQLGDLIAVMCDEFGLERPSAENPKSVNLGAESRIIPLSSIARRTRDTFTSRASESSPENNVDPQPTTTERRDESSMPSFGASTSLNTLVPPAIRIRSGAIPQIESILSNLS